MQKVVHYNSNFTHAKFGEFWSTGSAHFVFYKSDLVWKMEKPIPERRAGPAHCYRTDPGQFKRPLARSSTTSRAPSQIFRATRHVTRFCRTTSLTATGSACPWPRTTPLSPPPIKGVSGRRKTFFFPFSIAATKSFRPPPLNTG
jgi:hypothetical protein